MPLVIESQQEVLPWQQPNAAAKIIPATCKIEGKGVQKLCGDRANGVTSATCCNKTWREKNRQLIRSGQRL